MRLWYIILALALCVGCNAKVVKTTDAGKFQSVEFIDSGDWSKTNVMKITTDSTVVMVEAQPIVANKGEPCQITLYSDDSVWMFVGDICSIRIKKGN